MTKAVREGSEACFNNPFIPESFWNREPTVLARIQPQLLFIPSCSSRTLAGGWPLPPPPSSDLLVAVFIVVGCYRIVTDSRGSRRNIADSRGSLRNIANEMARIMEQAGGGLGLEATDISLTSNEPLSSSSSVMARCTHYFTQASHMFAPAL